MAFIQPRQNNIGNTLFLNDGKIGIGTDNPNQLLTIEGSVSIKEQASAKTDTAEYGQLWVKNSTPNELYFTTDAGNDIQLTSGTSIAGGGGAVSAVSNGANNRIATFSSSDALNGEANLTFDGNLLTVAGTNPQIRIGDDGAEDTSLVFMGNAQDFYMALDDTTDDLTIGTGTTIGSNVKMVIENGGNVGIGTTTPDSLLEISKDTDGELIALKLTNESDADDTTGQVSIQFDLEDTSGNAVDAGKILVLKEQSFTTASTQDSSMTFSTSLDGTLAENMRITGSGNVGIRVNNPTKTLHIKQTIDTAVSSGNVSGDVGDGIRIERQRDTLSWILSIDDDGSNPELYIVDDSGFDGIAVSGQSGNHINVTFTGQHRSLANTNLSLSSQGLIVSGSGNFLNLDLSNIPTINESLPIVSLSNSDNDKKVFGVVSNIEDNNSTRKHYSGSITSLISKKSNNEQRLFINSLGEGSIWICNKGSSNIENGDYITSSSVTGYGMKQTLHEGLLTNFTVAKITCDCNFSLEKITKQKLKVITTTTDGVTTTSIDYDEGGNIQYEDDLDENGNTQQVYKYETRFLDASGNLLIDEADYNTRLGNEESVYIACFVGCTYHCG